MRTHEQSFTNPQRIYDEVDCDTPEVIITNPAELANAIDTKTIIGIGNAETLAELANLVNGTSTFSPVVTKNCDGKTIVLTSDVDLSAICAANTDGDGNGGWNPIGTLSTHPFKGTFNGNGHKVMGLYIKRTGTNFQGLFGYSTGELKNIGVDGGSVTGNNYTGGVVGYTTNTITNCYSTGSISGKGQTGGLAGHAKQTITNCYATGNVTGDGERTGGLVGYAIEGITNCYATGLVSGTKYVGGLAGYTNSTTEKVSNCYALGDVIATDERAGGLVGWAKGEIENSYAKGRVSSEADFSGGLVGYAEKAISNSYAMGSVEGTSNTGGLAGYATQAITDSYATGSVTGKYYTGGLAGSADTITNSYATGSVTGKYCTGGLSGCANGAITNCYAVGNVTGQSCTGGLAGLAQGAINNSYATGSVTGTRNTGGLAGSANGAITNSYATGSVTGQDDTGGLAGSAEAITNSYATGTVTGNDLTGGLAGDASTITNSYSTGNVTGMDITGGLAGQVSGAITNSYATGSVTGQNYTGGFVGCYAGASIDTCYSGGKVYGNNSVGGFIGECWSGDDDITINISDSVSYSKVSGNERVGSFIGEYQRLFIEDCLGEGDDCTYTCTLILNNCTSANLSDYSMIRVYNYTFTETEDDYYETFEEDTEYDLTPLLAQIEGYNLLPSDIDLQVGINGDRSCRVNIDTNFKLNLNVSDLTSDKALSSVTNFINQLSQKSTEIGAAQNRLDSALESTLVKMDNLTSSLSTTRDADIGEVSSDYIRQQILQQAAATLMSTANQSPAIALQLI